jgi:glycosyltransferase involved in cell wall biosynthesis
VLGERDRRIGEMGESEQSVQVSIVIPAFNERDAIVGVIREVREAMQGTSYSFEILVVDDGSHDGTAERAQGEGARVIRHGQNRGSGASRKTGIRAALGEWIVMIDADGTYPATSIPEIVDPLKEFAQVIGARTVEKGTHRFLRSLAKETIRCLASFLVSTPIPDLNSGLRAFRKAEMLPYLYLIPNGFSCVSSMTLAFLTNDLPVRFVPISYYQRIGHSKFHPIRDTYRYLLTVVRIVTYFAPLNVFMPLCLFLLGLGFLKGFLDVLWTRTLQESDIILVLTGVLVGALGILADLIVVQGKRGHDGNR